MPSPRKKANATKGGGLEPSETATQESPSELHSDHPIELLPFSSHPVVRIVGLEEAPT